MLNIGVDVGGTFTDLVCVRDDRRALGLKVPSTRPDLHRGVLDGVARALEEMRSRPDEVSRIIHGTTVATNAIIEHKGANVGILMTSGFEDTLELGRYKRSSNYDVWFDAETPVFLAPRRRRRGVIERIDHNGNVLKPLDEAQVREAIISLVETQRVDALAICYLFSFVNDIHEQRTAALVTELYPQLAVSLSSRVNPETREYERLCVTAFDAYIRPVMSQYLGDLERGLREMGLKAPLQIMESSGGLSSISLAIERPSRTIMSGPAAGVKGALYAAGQSSYENIISIDIGGTSSDVSLGVGGRPLTSREGRVLTYPVRVPMIDVNSIGAGGGSIAWFDAGGSLRVGPHSAGADPGPACYGRGGRVATVTDASVVLGYLNPKYFAGGTLPLRADLAVAAVEEVASRLEVDIVKAGWGIHEIVNASMSDQIRLMTVGRGQDPRKFALVVLGGAGGVHGCAIAEELDIGTVLVPRIPGVLSAFGLLVSDVEYEQTSTFQMRLDEALENGEAGHELAAAFQRLEEEGHIAMARQGVARSDSETMHSLDLRYVGQSYELEIPVRGRMNRLEMAEVEPAFDTRHREVYGHSRVGEPKEIVNVRTTHVSHVDVPAVSTWSRCDTTAAAHLERRSRRDDDPDASRGDVVAGYRQAYFGGSGMVATAIRDRAALSPGAQFDGPAVIEQEDTTVVIRPGWHVVVDEHEQLVLSQE